MRTYERLNAEVVKFEAQDVITASVASAPTEDKVKCTCDTTGIHYANPFDRNDKRHYLTYEAENSKYCKADDHTCNGIGR